MFSFHVIDPLFQLIPKSHLSPLPTLLTSIGVSIVESGEQQESQLFQLLHQICDDEFDAYELESAETWMECTKNSRAAAQEIIQKQQPSTDTPTVVYKPVDPETAGPTDGPLFNGVELPSCHAVFIVAISADNKVAGGVVVEIYPACCTSMLSYVVTVPEFRGKGLAKLLVNYVAWHMQNFSTFFTASPLAALLVDVSQVASLNEKDFDSSAEFEEEKRVARERQLIWSKLGFSPCDYMMKYAGYLNAGSYCVGVYRELCKRRDSDDEESFLSIPSQTLRRFLEIMNVSVLHDEREALLAKSKQQEQEQEDTHQETSLLDEETFQRVTKQYVTDLRSEFSKLPALLKVGDEFWK